MIDQIDQKSYVEAHCIKYKQLVKGQKDNGRRETVTRQMINNKKTLKHCLFVCFASVTWNMTQRPLLAL